MMREYNRFRIAFIALAALTVYTSCLYADDAATQHYVSYAVNDFTQEVVEQENKAFYDLFGQKITNGYHLYTFESLLENYTAATRADSILNLNDEYRQNKFFTNFNNLCISNDRIGGIKSSLIIGDMIKTQFSQLTMNKMHFSGLRWDLLAENGLAFTSLMSRTRPGRMAMQTSGGHSYVSYPYLYTQETAEAWDNEDGDDWTVQTMFGDYDMFFGFHGEKNFGEHLNLGATFMNHHRNDIKNGESWIGELPEAFAPEEIHFEIYDMTPDDLNDADARLDGLRMTVNGNIDGGGPAGMYYVDPADNVLRAYPDQVMGKSAGGKHPLICTFYPGEHVSGTDAVEKVEFEFTVSGNYLVFVSTEKMTPLYKHWGIIGYNRDGEQLKGPVQKQIREIVGVEINKSITNDPRSFPGVQSLYLNRSEVYFGDYIARAPRVTPDYSNTTTYRYEYRMMLASMTGSVNFDGKLLGTDYNGEVAFNAKRYAYPGDDGDVTYSGHMAGFLQLNRRQLAVSGWLSGIEGSMDLYALDAEYEPNLPHFQVSRSLAFMNNHTLKLAAWREDGFYPHYNDYPIQLCNYWSTIDDNEDDDYFVETERQLYPSDLPVNTASHFFGDGSMKSNNEASWGGITGHVRLPSGFDVVYDDNDGVIAERYDRNRDGVADYRQNFLLFDADPPQLSLDVDRNNNKVFDLEEDDLYPDFPYEAGYVYTSNGVRSLGVRGTRFLFGATPYANMRTELGGVFEQVQDPDLDGNSGSDAERGEEGRNVSLYSFTTYKKQDRERGITYFAGEELKKVNDGIRNDVIVGTYDDDENAIVYSVKPDMLQLKNAFVSNSAVGIEYRRNGAVLASRMFYGLERRFASDSIYVTRALTDTIFTNDKVAYDDKTVNSFIFLAKASYDIKPRFNFSGIWGGLNLFNRLTLVPQYKFMYERYGSGEADPRVDNAVLSTYTADDSLLSYYDWLAYLDNNEEVLYSVPILRMSYSIGEKTFIEGGWQWKRVYNYGVTEESMLQKTMVLQLRNQTTYQGYAITMLLGVSTDDVNYDTNRWNGCYHYGDDFDRKDSQVYFRIFAGIN